MEVLGPETIKAIRNRKNKPVWRWVLSRGVDAYRNYDFVIKVLDDEALVKITFPGRPDLDEVVKKEIEEIAKRM